MPHAQSPAAKANTVNIPRTLSLRDNRRERPMPQKIIPTHGRNSAYVQRSQEPLWCNNEALVLALMVSVVVAAPLPLGVTESGEKLHVVPDGKPLQEKLTWELNPFSGVTVSAVFALCPAATVKEVEFAAN